MKLKGIAEVKESDRIIQDCAAIKKAMKKVVKNKTYIVYPHGALSWEEILETVELLKTERANPKIVKHNGFWNVQAQRKEEVSE